MNLVSISIQNFGSFRAPQTLHFPQTPGLYFMQGRNLLEPRLGGNGAGKSTIWNAIHWLAFGRMPDGRKAGDIANWGVGKGAEVELAYNYGREWEYVTVSRTWGPISWKMMVDATEYQDTLDLAKQAENPFLADLGCNEKLFQQCVLMAQGEPMFLDLKREAQAELFSNVLGLDQWIQYSNQASTMARRADDECRRLEAQVAKLEGLWEGLRDYGAEIHDFEKKRRDRLDQIFTDFDFCESGRVKDKEGLKRVEEETNSLHNHLVTLKKRLADARADLMGAEKRLTEINSELRTAERDAERIIQRCNMHDEGGECPTCGMSLDGKGAAAAGKKLMKEVEVLEDLVRKLNSHAKTAQGKRDACQKELRELEGKIDEQEDLIAAADRVGRKLRTAIDQAARRLDQLEEEAERVKAERNPFRAMQEDAQERARMARTELSEAREALDKAQEKYALYGLWVRGFKDLRLQQIAEALTELEIEVNSSLVELGLGGWELRFDVDKESKSGSVQRGFSVTVISPDSPKAVPWECWSGGEQQRLRLAGNMGLSNLIRSRMGVRIPLEVWDEPTKGLSPEGVRDLLTCLERRARVEQRQIWVIDHTAHSFGGFSGTATIIKDADGSRIEFV